MSQGPTWESGEKRRFCDQSRERGDAAAVDPSQDICGVVWRKKNMVQPV